MKAFNNFACGGEVLLADMFDRFAAPVNQVDHKSQSKDDNDSSDQKVFGHQDHFNFILNQVLLSYASFFGLNL
jgi:hypothetical protein